MLLCHVRNCHRPWDHLESHFAGQSFVRFHRGRLMWSAKFVWQCCTSALMLHPRVFGQHKKMMNRWIVILWEQWNVYTHRCQASLPSMAPGFFCKTLCETQEAFVSSAPWSDETSTGRPWTRTHWDHVGSIPGMGSSHRPGTFQTMVQRVMFHQGWPRKSESSFIHLSHQSCRMSRALCITKQQLIVWAWWHCKTNLRQVEEVLPCTQPFKVPLD